MKKRMISLFALCCMLAITFTACGRDDKGNNNSVTDGTYGQTTSPSPTGNPSNTPINNQGTPDNTGNLGDDIINGVDDIGNGVMNGVDDVIDGVGDALDGNNDTNGGTR